jgi:hypothetical protein
MFLQTISYNKTIKKWIDKNIINFILIKLKIITPEIFTKINRILIDSKLSITSIILTGSETTEIIFSINNLELDNSLEIINEKNPGETISVLKVSSIIVNIWGSNRY